MNPMKIKAVSDITGLNKIVESCTMSHSIVCMVRSGVATSLLRLAVSPVACHLPSPS